MGKKELLILILTLLLIALVIPFNQLSFINDDQGNIRLTQVDRHSILGRYGTFYTPGEFKNKFKKPGKYVNPHYINTGFDRGSFDLYVEFRNDTIIFYEGSYCEVKGLDGTFQLRELPNSHGEFSWRTILEDTTGKHIRLPVK